MQVFEAQEIQHRARIADAPIEGHSEATCPLCRGQAPMTESEAADLLNELIDETVVLGSGETQVSVPALNIVTNEPVADYAARIGGDFTETFGVSDNPKLPHFNRLEAVVDIEAQAGTKILEVAPDVFKRVEIVRYVASSALYEMPDGRQTRDATMSGPERFTVEADGSVAQHGAATALLARLLEGAAALGS